MIKQLEIKLVALHLLLATIILMSLVIPAAISQTNDQPVAESKQLAVSTDVAGASSENIKNTQVQRLSSATRSNSSRKIKPSNINSTSSNNSRKRNYNNEMKSNTSSSQRKQANNLATPATSSQPDPSVLARQQAQLIRSYNNTPPLFLTPTRDFYVDVGQQPLGTTIRTMSAIDLEGDRLEYTLKPANARDASPYFSINPATGELKLANKQLVFQVSRRSQLVSPLVNSSLSPADTTRSYENSENTEIDEDDKGGDSDDDEVVDRKYMIGAAADDNDADDQNLYFLNVAADDGKYSSIVELQIHVLNSSSPNQNRDDARVGSSVGQIDKLVQRKSAEFYNKLYRLTPTNNSSKNSSLVVYPNFVNPSIVMPQQESHPITEAATIIQDGTSSSSEEFSSSLPTQRPGSLHSSNKPNKIDDIKANNIEIVSSPISSASGGQPPAELTLQPAVGSIGGSSEPFIAQPMGLALVVISAALVIALVLLMFIVPMSVKKLRKRLKHVELQHEQISQKTSNGSSTICSSSSNSLASHLHHHHNPSLSQFTIGSSACQTTSNTPSVCRQSSLDSAISQQTTQLSSSSHQPQYQRQRSQFMCPPISNPVYLQHQHNQQHQSQLIQNQAFSMPKNQCQISSPIGQPTSLAHQPNINIYHPIDDEFYSTIDTESTALDFDAIEKQTNSNKQQIDGLHFITQYQPAESQRPIESPSSDSGSSTASLSRFLSLPARRAVHAASRQQQQRETYIENHQSDLNNSNSDDPLVGLPVIPVAKTIARSSHVEREQSKLQSNNNWELDRHRLRFLDILDEGQFGMVWRCNLKDETGERIVAVKTLKNSSAKDERGREELLAEIDIMKLVCQHPNVVKILHCCTANSSKSSVTNVADMKPILLVMEYEELGKLQSFLEKSRINHSYATNLYNNSSDLLTSRDLVKFIYHVAKGMEYISAHCIVHRDLASRNILVSSHRICKIGDFGMARHMQSSSGIYERHSRNTKVPVRWMAPEVLLENKFTIKSDVFSFGILMWEIVTLGSTPYRHLKTEQVIDRVARQGERPDRPEYCHEQLYKIMSQCWNDSPEVRPTFSQLSKELAELLLSADDYIELDQYPDHNYCNIPGSAAPNELL